MKFLSNIAVMTALALSVPSIAYAQVDLSGTVNTDTSGALGGGSDTSGNVSVGSGDSTTTVDINGSETTNPNQSGSGSVSVNTIENGSLVANFDANGDGAISQDEVAAANIILGLGGSNATVDLNGDGNITQDELAQAQINVAIATNLLDTNGDGVISRSEQAAARGDRTGSVSSSGGFSSIACAKTGLNRMIPASVRPTWASSPAHPM